MTFNSEVAQPNLHTNAYAVVLKHPIEGMYKFAGNNGRDFTAYERLFTQDEATKLLRKVKRRGYEARVVEFPNTRTDIGLRYLIETDGRLSERYLQAAPAVNLCEPTPDWFVAAMRRGVPESHYWSFDDWTPQEQAWNTFCHHYSSRGWMDHYGWYTNDGVTLLVSEPYAITDEDLTKLQRFCNECDLSFQIRGLSNHYPGRTIRIEIAPKSVKCW